MSRMHRKSQGRKINSTYFVFCEGKTEEAYSKFLRQKYRLPIEIKTKVTWQEISDKFITNYLKGKLTTDFDKIYLMYDLDTEEFMPKLKSVQKGIVLGSKPSDADGLLWEKLPDCMNETQKKNKIRDLLSELRKKEIIYNPMMSRTIPQQPRNIMQSNKQSYKNSVNNTLIIATSIYQPIKI